MSAFAPLLERDKGLMKQFLMGSAAVIAVAIPGAAFAQSTGSQDFEDTIVVTGATADQGVGGVKIPDSPKAKVVLTQEIIERQRPGQTVNEIINLVPGVSFTNNDPWGSSGGSFTIRGFSSDRIAQILDGIPLNDSGNYAIYTNQQIDPELVESINVNLGATDVDSPTAAAVGGTVNINTLVPKDELGALASISYGNIVADGSGDRPYYRMFGLLHTGDLTGHGTKAWISASRAYNKASFADYGKILKAQYNGKIWQDIGTNGDFISLAGHYNVNRNNFGGSPGSAAAFDGDKSARFYNVSGGIPCEINTEANPAIADQTNSCGTQFERRYNPSNTGNARLSTRLTLTDRLIFSADAAYQYVKANGGGTTSAYEAPFVSGDDALSGYFNGSAYFNRDLNGDGTLGVDVNGDGVIRDYTVTNTDGTTSTIRESDRVLITNPSQTQTKRWVAIANLSYEFDENNRVRLSYSFDRARHRQTGEGALVEFNGEPADVFPVNDPLTDADGNVLQKRDRKSYAILHQIAGEYRGTFFDDLLTVNLGVRAPFFKRELNQYCFTSAPNGNVNCVAGGNVADYAAANPSFAAPQSRNYKYDKLLPNVGAIFKITPEVSIAGSYAANISVPGTDTLYNSIYLPADNAASKPVAETSDSFDLALRYQSNIVQAAVTGWYAKYKNRIASAYSFECDCSIDTNLGAVKKYGIDANVSVRPMPGLLVYAFGSWIESEIGSDVQTGADTIAETKGNRERGAPSYLVGGRIQGTLGPVDLGAQIKRTGSRYLNDINTFKVDGYTVVDLDLRYNLANLGLEKSFFQLNVSNLFDKFYIGSFSGGLTTASSTFVNYGAPRAISGSLVVAF